MKNFFSPLPLFCKQKKELEELIAVISFLKLHIENETHLETRALGERFEEILFYRLRVRKRPPGCCCCCDCEEAGCFCWDCGAGGGGPVAAAAAAACASSAAAALLPPGGALTAANAVRAPRKKGRTALSSEAVMLVSLTAMGPVSWLMPSRSLP